MATPYASLSSGSPNAALPAAVEWVERLLLGEAGMVIAVLAIAGIGLAMLSGRLPARRGMRVILGAFILFGAPLIARGLMDLPQGVSNATPIRPVVDDLVPQPLPKQPPNYDPYAGASVPM